MSEPKFGNLELILHFPFFFFNFVTQLIGTFSQGLDYESFAFNMLFLMRLFLREMEAPSSWGFSNTEKGRSCIAGSLRWL